VKLVITSCTKQQHRSLSAVPNAAIFGMDVAKYFLQNSYVSLLRRCRSGINIFPFTSLLKSTVLREWPSQFSSNISTRALLDRYLISSLALSTSKWESYNGNVSNMLSLFPSHFRILQV